MVAGGAPGRLPQNWGPGGDLLPPPLLLGEGPGVGFLAGEPAYARWRIRQWYPGGTAEGGAALGRSSLRDFGVWPWLSQH